MSRTLPIACVLLAAASYILFGTWWAASSPPPDIENGDEVGRSGGPELAVTGPLPPKDAETEALRILAKLKSFDSAGAAAWLLEMQSREPPLEMAYHPELAAFLADRLGTAGPRLTSMAMHFLQRMGPAAAPHVTDFLTSAVTPARRTAAFAVIEYWHRNGQAFEMPPLLPLIQAQGKYGKLIILEMVSRGVPYDADLATYLADLLRKRADSSANSPGAGLARMGPQGVAMLVDMTAADSLRERLAAFYALGRARAEDLRPHLPMLAALIRDGQENGSVRIAAIFALRAMEGDCVECLSSLRLALTEEFPECLKMVLSVLDQMGPRAADAAPDLLPWLDEPDPRRGDPVATVLGKIGAHRDLVLPALVAVIERRGSDAAAKAMAAYGLDAYAPAERILDEGDAYAQYSILWVFAQLGERAAQIVPKLIPLLDCGDQDIRKRVVGTLGYIGPKASAAVPAIMKLLAEGEYTLPSHSAAAALARLGPTVEPALLSALRSSSETEVRQAVRVLTHFTFRTAFAMDELERLARSEDAALRAEAVEAVGVSIFDTMDPELVPVPAQDAVFVARVRALMEAAKSDPDAKVRERARKFLLWLDLRAGKPVAEDR